MSEQAPIVIIGSGLAGYSFARELRKLDTATPIILLSEGNGEFYSKPTLSNAFGLKRGPAELATSTAAQMAAQLSIEVRPHTVVRAIEPGAHRIVLDTATVTYSRAVLAVGARPLGQDIAAENDGVHVVNSLDDYRRFHPRVGGCRRVVILGAGFIGCEFANDLLGAGVQVDVADLASYALARFWPPAMAEVFQARLAAAGVRWHLGRKIVRIRREDDISAVELDDGSVLYGGLVLSALGLAPNIGLAAAAGLRVNRGICVDGELRTSDPDIFALGDCAEVRQQVLPFIMPIMHCARALAKTLSGTGATVDYPPMPVVLKTPACPGVFIPVNAGAVGEWQIEQSGEGMAGSFVTSSGELAGVALLGTAVSRRNEFVQRLQSQAAKPS